jgi:hypothetical protein
VYTHNFSKTTKKTFPGSRVFVFAYETQVAGVAMAVTRSPPRWHGLTSGGEGAGLADLGAGG